MVLSYLALQQMLIFTLIHSTKKEKKKNIDKQQGDGYQEDQITLVT